MESRSALVERIIIGTLLGVGREGPFDRSDADSKHYRWLAASVLRAAAIAFGRYGRGIPAERGSISRDCTAYELAMTMNAPLLFKGDDSRRPTCGHAFELIPLPVVRMHRARRVIRARPLRLSTNHRMRTNRLAISRVIACNARVIAPLGGVWNRASNLRSMRMAKPLLSSALPHMVHRGNGHGTLEG
jgi:hypothetical protein